MRQRRRDGGELHLQPAGDHVGHRLGRSLVGHVGEVDAGHGGEQRGGEMREARHAGRAVVERAGLGLGQRDQLGDVVHREPRIDHQHIGRGADHHDRREILDRIVRQVSAQTHRHRVRARGGDADRVAVGRRLGDRVGADIAAGADPVVDHDLLAQPGPQPLRQDARDDVGAAAGRERHDQPDRPVRPGSVAGLRGGGARCQHRRQRHRHKPHHRKSPGVAALNEPAGPTCRAGGGPRSPCGRRPLRPGDRA